MGAIGSFGGNVSATSTSDVTTGKVENATIAMANIEQSHTFPANSKAIQIKARDSGKIKLSFDTGTSGSVYQTIWPGSVYCQENIIAPSVTIYFQSPDAGLVIELTSWS